MKQETEKFDFILNAQAVDQIAQSIERDLAQLEMDRSEIVHIRLGMEEMLLSQLPVNEGNKCTYAFYTKMGRPFIRITVQGVEKSQDAEDNEFSEYSHRILETMSIVPTEYYKNGRNVIQIKLKKKQRSMMHYLVVAIALAAIIGIIGKLAPPGISTVIYGIVNPLMDAFLGVLTTMAGPMIFLSVTWGIFCIGDVALLGTVGRKLMLRFVAMTFILTIAGFGLGALFIHMDFSSTSIKWSQLGDIYKMILNILPSNIVEPFYENNTMQIIVIAIAFGLSMLLLERQATVVADVAEQLNNVVQFLMGTIAKLIPVFVFISLLQMILSDSIMQALGCWQLIVLLVAIPMILLAVIFIFTSYSVKISISELIRSTMPTFLIGLTTASSAAAFAENINCCENKFGIKQNLTKFGIPVGMVVYMPTLSIGFILISMFMANTYGVSISVGWVVIGIIASCILAIAVPPIPGGSITCYAILFAQLGIPDQAIGIATIIDVIFDFYCTATCLVLLQLELLQQAQSMKLRENVN